MSVVQQSTVPPRIIMSYLPAYARADDNNIIYLKICKCPDGYNNEVFV